jgi:hypothetical protein
MRGAEPCFGRPDEHLSRPIVLQQAEVGRRSLPNRGQPAEVLP